jgi:protein-S-isoprenylcysteine O-methyltransferase Ste14
VHLAGMQDLTPVTAGEALNGAWVVWFVTWWAAAWWSDRSTGRAAARRQIQYRVLVSVGAILLFGAYHHRPGTEVTLWRLPEPMQWITVAATVAGLAFTWWARLHLGRLWSSNVARKADHHVIDSGPYGVVRHPIYTGIILASTATAVLRGTAAGWLGVAIMTAGWYVKARTEERYLREELGADAYDAYARRVPMLVPFVG